ncbi:MAG: hypothetical protein E6Q83_04725 [Thiothrix sp.]|nr:MAG: hypothetical protein E6Q83_04725 [Thiothrix sp.]
MAERVIVYWRDIPSQVILKKGRLKGKALLNEKFQEAIDKAAIRAGKAGTDDYVAEWHRVTSEVEVGADLDEAARQEVAALEAQFPEEVLEQIIRNGGVITA